MDRAQASEACDAGSIPAGDTRKGEGRGGDRWFFTCRQAGIPRRDTKNDGSGSEKGRIFSMNSELARENPEE